VINPADIHAIAAAFEAGRRVVRERRERMHAQWVAARNRARQRERPHVAAEAGDGSTRCATPCPK
jgi:hypothetical protein